MPGDDLFELAALRFEPGGEPLDGVVALQLNQNRALPSAAD